MKKANKKISLSEYYHSLPVAIYPKTGLIREITIRCNVSQNTARNWIFGACRPANEHHLDILSEITGIDKTNLFNN